MQCVTIPRVTGVSPVLHIGSLHTVELVGGAKRTRMELAAYEPESGCDPVLVAGRSLRKDDVAKIVTSQALLRNLGYDGDPQGAVGQILLGTTRPGYTAWGSEVVGPPPPNDADQYWRFLEQRVTRFEAQIIGVMASGPTEMFMNLTNLHWGRDLNGWREWCEENDGSGNEVWTSVLVSEFERRGYETVLVMVDNVAHVQAVAGAVENLRLGTRTARDVLDNLAVATRILSLILGAIGAVSLGVATIGIVNTMVMAIYERTREIGVMRACGATRATIRCLFAFEAAVLRFLGGVLDPGMSWVLAVAGNHWLNRFAESYGVMARNAIAFPPWLTNGVVAFTTVIGLVAGLYPAVRAARLNPVEALRYK
ncbi:MAG: ABC transporter permease [Bacillota bacterium]